MKRLAFLLAFFMLSSILCAPAQAQERAIVHFLKTHRGTLLRLTVLTASAEFDAYSTRRVMTAWQGFPTPPAFTQRPHEANPFERPFAGSPLLYFSVPAQDLLIWTTASVLLGHHRKAYRLVITDGALGYETANHILYGFRNLSSASRWEAQRRHFCSGSPSYPGCQPSR